MNAPLHQAGFSLIEVMVAILIMGIALVGLTHGITTALDSSKESEQQTVAALFASGKIETLRAEGGLETRPVQLSDRILREDGPTARHIDQRPRGDCLQLPYAEWGRSCLPAGAIG